MSTTTTSIEALLRNLRNRDVKLWVENGRLRVNAPRGTLTEELRSELSRNKAEILAFLGSVRTVTSSYSPEIEPVRRDGPLPVSFSQQRLWFLNQFEPGNPAYNIPGMRRLKGELQLDVLTRTLQEITRRHETLRTSFTIVAGRPVQVVSAQLTVRVPLIDLSALEPDERRQTATLLSQKEAFRPFELSEAPLLRATVIRLAPDDHVLVTRMHHIISDEWSLGVYNREFATLYETFREGKPSPLPELPIQYADYAAWQRRFLSGERLDEQLAYWKRQLGGTLPVLALPTDRPRPKVQTSRGATRAFSLTQSLTAELNALSQREGVTLFMTLLAALNVLLHHYTGQDDLIVGTPIANRRRAELEGLIGFFVNSLVIRCDLSGDPTFRELLQRVREIALEAFAHQDVPFEKLVEELSPERDPSQNPVFQMMFILQNTPRADKAVAGLTATALDNDEAVSPNSVARRVDASKERKPRPAHARFDITIDMKEWKGYLFGGIEYNTDLFDDSSIARFVNHFGTVVSGVVKHPEARVSELSPLTAPERTLLLETWNDTRSTYHGNETITSWFESQAARTPDRVALVADAERLTFRELDVRANHLASRLRALGIGPEVPVGIFIGRSSSMVEGLLGILKAGGAYVPLDPAYPLDRIAFMIEDADLEVIVTVSELEGRLPRAGDAVRVVTLDVEDTPVADSASKRRVFPDNPLYAIYTSGSTGTPKGVLGLHRAALNRFEWMWRTFPFEEGDVCCQKTSLNFVDSVWEIFGPLLGGVPLVILSEGASKDPYGMVAELSRHGVTRMVLVPSLLRVLLASHTDLAERLPKLGLWFTSGEALSPELASLFKERMPHARLVNLYGSSEVAADSTCYDTSKEDTPSRIPIGRPIANTRAYVLNRDLTPVALGVTGELYIGGEGLARGYANRPDWTAERFLPNPFAESEGERLYRTGDRARYRPDGEIEYMGRADHQVKIRGFRIELGEVESALSKHEKLSETLVVVRDGGDEGATLVAYVVPRDQRAVHASELRSFLQDKLPAHMVPASIVVMDALPLTPNGKVDRRALPAPERSRADVAETYVAPAIELERVIASVWQEVLGVDRVGVHDNYFDLGGHSLLMVEVHDKLQFATGREMSIVDLFQYPTVHTLYKFLSRRDDAHGEEASSAGDARRARARRREELIDRRRELRQNRRRMP